MKIKFPKIKKDYQKENFKFDPDKYWKALVIAMFMLIIVSFVFAFNLFIQTNKKNDLNTGNNGQKIGNKEEEKIKKALLYFAEREKKSNEILNSPAPVIDPTF